MKAFFRLLSLLLTTLLVLSFTACDLSFVKDALGEAPDDGDFTPPTFTKVTATEFGDTYGDQLSPNEKAIYDVILATEVGKNEFAVTLPEALTLCKGRAPTEEEQESAKEKLTFWISNAVFAAWLDAPTLFWLDFGDYRYSCAFKQNGEGIVGVVDLTVTVALRTDAQTAASRTAALNARADALLSDLPDSASDAETVRAINSLLCDAVEYALNAPDRGTAAGALVDGKCVCEGYARAFQLLCEKAGISAVCILGKAKSNGETEGHMWNAVRIDGAWYYCDPTWNDTTASEKYLLVGGNTMGHEGTFDKTHFPENTLGKSKPFALPDASSTALSQ